MAGDGGGNVAEEPTDMGDGTLCSQHPFKKTPAGICGFCLQEKLGNLVSSPFATIPILGRSSSSSPSPSFRSDIASVYGGGFKHKSSAAASSSSSSAISNAECHARRSRVPFLLSRKKTTDFAAFSRSKSTTRRVPTGDAEKVFEKSPRRRKAGLWPFLNLSSKPAAVSGAKITSSANPSSREEDDDGLRQEERKVSRSRSVGCGSRSFSGDFFGRISTGFGDCTLLRAESQREAKPIKSSSSSQGRQSSRRCGGIFGGFMLTSSSSSSSSSSRWVSDDIAGGNKQVVGNGRSSQQKSSWGWALASPMRALSRPWSKKGGTTAAPEPDDTMIKKGGSVGAVPALLTTPELKIRR